MKLVYIEILLFFRVHAGPAILRFQHLRHVSGDLDSELGVSKMGHLSKRIPERQ